MNYFMWNRSLYHAIWNVRNFVALYGTIHRTGQLEILNDVLYHETWDTATVYCTMKCEINGMIFQKVCGTRHRSKHGMLGKIHRTGWKY